MEKKLTAAIALAVLSNVAFAGQGIQSKAGFDTLDTDKSGTLSQAEWQAYKTQKSAQIPSSSDRSADRTSGASASNSIVNRGQTGWSGSDAALSELSADPQVTLFYRLDTDKDGILSSQELQTGKNHLVINVSGANTSPTSSSAGGIDLQSFKTAISNSMLGLSASTTSATPSSASVTPPAPGTDRATNDLSPDRTIQGAGADGSTGQGAGADGSTGGMLSDKIMDQAEKDGGPTMLRGGPNPSPDGLTPEQTINSGAPSTP